MKSSTEFRPFSKFTLCLLRFVRLDAIGAVAVGCEVNFGAATLVHGEHGRDGHAHAVEIDVHDICRIITQNLDAEQVLVVISVRRQLQRALMLTEAVWRQETTQFLNQRVVVYGCTATPAVVKNRKNPIWMILVISGQSIRV